MLTIFSPQNIVDLHVHYDEPGCIGLALADLQSDLQKLCGQVAEIKPYLPVNECGVIVAGSLETTSFRAYVNRLGIDISTLETMWEGFITCTFGDRDENLLICGSDRRGTMWGIYDFCEQQLGADPLYFWTDNEPQPRLELTIPPYRKVDGPKTFTFRGFFVNDEDLLSEWKANGGIRYADYPHYHQVVHPTIIERVVETALRLKMNLIIPASLLDIANPPEENLVRLVTDRGLYVSQHHIEPVGVSHFAWENYWKNQGEPVEPSYIRHPEKFDQIWRDYAARWSQYPGVIWQVGLRGRGDRPVWFNDSAVPQSDEARGQLISSAYEHQITIIKEALGHSNFLSTATLWMEGSQLQQKGCLSFPQNTAIIFSDFGSTQMMVDDFYETIRDPQRKYGVYHHVAFWGDGPHLVQGTSLEKLYFNYSKAVEFGDTFYSILNVSNVREFPLGIEAVARMNWDITGFDVDTYRKNWYARQFGKQAVPALDHVYRKFFDAYIRLENTRFPGEMLLMDGITRILGMQLIDLKIDSFPRPGFIVNKLYMRFDNIEGFLAFYTPALETGIKNWQDAFSAAYDALQYIDPSRRQYFTDQYIVQIEIMLGLYGWFYKLCLATREKNTGNAAAYHKYLKQAVFAMEKLLIDRKKVEHGKWEYWYRGDKKMNLPLSLQKTREMLMEGAIS